MQYRSARNASSVPGSAVNTSPVPVVRRECGAGACRLDVNAITVAHVSHLGACVRQPEGALRGLDGERAARIEREVPEPRLAVARHVGANADLREGGDARQRGQSAEAQARQQEGRDAEPGRAAVHLELDRARQQALELARLEPPMEEGMLDPGLSLRPRLVGHGPRPVRNAVEHVRLTGGRFEEVGRMGQRFPRSACSRSIASNSALKLPSPKPRAPWRSITSKKSVGRSWAVFVKIWSR